MKKSLTISKENQPHKSMEYEALYKEGIRYIQKYSGAIWTDYNLHDPGITMLEYLCYGITDIGYRCNFPITDLLYARENRRITTVDNAFYPPEKILPCAALIPRDYRKLIIDRIEGVENVWIEPVMAQKEKFRGLYDVRLELNTERQSKSTPQMIQKEVRALLAANRNLCEDIRDLIILEQESLEIEAKIELHSDASSEQVLADIIHELEHFLVPKVVFHTLEQMLAEGFDINDLHDGPEPRRGYINSSELRPLHTAISLSQLRDTIMGVVGVSSIMQIKVKLNGLPHFDEEIDIKPNTYFTLSESMKDLQDAKEHPITFRRNNQAIQPNYFTAWQILGAHVARDSQHFSGNLEVKNRPTAVEKDLADIGAYYSIQRFFPAVYGIGAYGLPRDSNFLRQAQARQLKGYLAIFETMLASYLQQLTQVRHLFSIEEKIVDPTTNNTNADQTTIGLDLDNPDADPTYFAQFPFDIPDIEPLLHIERKGAAASYTQTPIWEKDAIDKNLKAAVQSVLAQNTALQDQALDRRNEFLDHLLARFGQSVDAEWLQQFQLDPEDLTLAKKNLIKTKCRILKDYESFSRDRGKGFDYSAQQATNDSTRAETEIPVGSNVSGLKKRLSALINLPSSADHRLTNFNLSDVFDIRKELKNPSDPETKAVGIPLKAILQNGQSADQYEVTADDEGECYDVWYHGTHKGNPHRYHLFVADTQEEAVHKRNQFIKALRDFDLDSRGFYVVEHLLLRPIQLGGYKLKLKVNAEPEVKDTFESVFYTPLAQIEGVSEGILTTASSAQNYDILPDGAQFFIVLKQNGRPLLMSSNSHSEKEAEAIRDSLVNIMQVVLKHSPDAPNDAEAEGNTKITRSSLNEWIDSEPQAVKGMDVDNSFYAHRLSIVLPKWPNVFREHRFQLWFKQLVEQNLPAHLRAQLLWLDYAEMKSFEDCYHGWLELKNRPEFQSNELDERSFKLVEALTPAGPEREKLTRLTNSSGLSQERLNALFSKFKGTFLFEPTELQIFEGIDATLEYWLKKHHIGTWTLLSISTEETLDAVWRKAGANQPMPDFSSWKEQAKLMASKANRARPEKSRVWDDLEKMQQLLSPGVSTKLRRMMIEKLKAIRKMTDEELQILLNNLS